MTQSSIIIVGAGAAGIAAAQWLQDRGRKVIVLEARSRVGGRAWTDVATFGFPVDMGCAWLHSADRNPWMQYAREKGFEIIERLPGWQRRIGAEEASPEYTAAWRAAYDRNDALIARAAEAGRDVAVSQIVPDDRHRPMFDAVMTWLMGTDSERVSSVDFTRYADSNVNWAVREGLGTVVAHAARAVDVQLDTPVQSIDWRHNAVRVTTPRGTLEGAAVIVTLPTTILATGGPRFLPALPLALLEAFVAVPLGIANKVFFEMQPGALPYDEALHFVGTDTTVRTASYQVRPSGREILLAYFGGALALELEQRGELETFARDQLASIFGSDFPARIRRSRHSAWAGDVWSRGSYSATLPGKAHMRERLGAVVGERVFFAGEACSIDSFGTIHGAWHSGVSAARRVLQLGAE